MQFSILKKGKRSRARIGVLKTAHGEVETPTLVTVATQAAVKALTVHQVKAAHSPLLICNTFHLHLKPGEKIVKNAGGIHSFMGWDKPLMTDSGGFQVFSLGFGRDFGMGKLLKEKEKSGVNIALGNQPGQVKITEEGVHFRSPVDGKKLFIGPKESIRIQEALGADIIFAFDECTSPIADLAYTASSLARTHRWAAECLKYHGTKQALFGIVQGGKFKTLRKESAAYVGNMPFDGFGIGGEFGDDKKTLVSMLRTVIAELPEEKPRHLLGIGHIEDIKHIIKEGVDTFDCTVPTHYARTGVAFTSRGRLDLSKSGFLKDKKPLDSTCGCFVCAEYKRNYIAHLIRAKEMLAATLLSFHNLHFFNTYIANIRREIKQGKW